MMRSSTIKTGLFSRTLTTLKLSALLGRKVFKKILNGQPLAPEEAVVAMERLSAEFDGMKGLIMKFGQIASYLGSQLPPEARQALERLQSTGSAMPFEQVQAMIEFELQSPIESVFDTIDQQPFAAASIGQVHEATLNGKRVAVKVQYPNIERLISHDLRIVGSLLLALLAATSMPGRALLQELTDRLKEECDYQLEADRQERIRLRLLANSDSMSKGTQIPRVFLHHSSKRVLTSERIDAHSFQIFRDSAPQAAKNLAAQRIFYHTFDSIFRGCYFNGDPQPGNYLFSESGEVTFLDFGCIRVFSTDFIQQWKRLANAVLNQDKQRVRIATLDMNLVSNEKRFDFDYHFEMLSHIYTPYRSINRFRYTPQYNKTTNNYLLWQNKNRLYAHLPAPFLFINRLQWGLASLLADLRAEAIWSEIFKSLITADEVPLFSESTISES